jgi:hypothetical protein
MMKIYVNKLQMTSNYLFICYLLVPMFIRFRLCVFDWHILAECLFVRVSEIITSRKTFISRFPSRQMQRCSATVGWQDP